MREEPQYRDGQAMRPPRARFTVRRMMLGIALVSIGVAWGSRSLKIYRRWDACQSRAATYAEHERQCLHGVQLFGRLEKEARARGKQSEAEAFGSTSRNMSRHAEDARALKRLYLKAAERPW